MLKNLLPLNFPIILGSEHLYLRYTLLSELYLEHCNLSRAELNDKDVYSKEEITHLLRAGLFDYYRKSNNKFIEDFEFDRMKPSYESIYNLINDDEETLTLQIIRAILLATPIPPVIGDDGSNLKTSSGDIDYAVWRCLYTDIMHRSDTEFWNSTLREIYERWDIYAECKGFKEKAEEVQEFDDEGV